jgi:RNA polymerase sigma factor (sigma-70 family)
MPPSGLSAAVARARRAVAPADPRSDGALLDAFVAARDGAAFAALVERFGPMVFAVCRRHTGHHHDAEDVFQAVFVVLARRAGCVVPREAVGGWLYGVAVRTAREARAMAARRTARETPSARLPDPVAASAHPDPERAAVLDAELAALPEKYRTLLVRCDLRDEPQVEVAAALGVPVGTVYSRLATARKLLAARLRARGVGLGTGGLAAALGDAARAVPPDLSARAVASALTPESLPAAVAALSQGVLRAMLIEKLKLVPLATGLVAAAALAAGVLAAPTPTPPAEPRVPVGLGVAQDPRKASPAPKAAPDPGRLLFIKDGRLFGAKPDGTGEAELATQVQNAAVSPDGKWLAVSTYVAPKGGGAGGSFRAILRRPGEKGTGVPLADDVPAPGDVSFIWAPDSARVLVQKSVPTGNPDPARLTTANAVYDLTTRTSEPLKEPEGFRMRVRDWFPDGKSFLSNMLPRNDPDGNRLARVPVAGGPPEFLTPAGAEGVRGGKLSPDGTRVLVTEDDPKANAPGASRLSVLDLKTGKTTPVPAAAPGWVGGYAWSPDGRRVAFDWRAAPERPGGPAPAPAHFVVVCDVDGANRRAVVTYGLDLGGTVVSPWVASNRGLRLVGWR